MSTPKKTSLAFVIHITKNIKDKLQEIRKELKLETISEAIIALVDDYCNKDEDLIE